jgi:RHS repeat-associated protein
MTLLCLTTILASGAVTAARAQTPVRQSIDANGVDLFLGTMNVDGPVLTAGAPGNPSIAYMMTFRGTSFADNVNAKLYKSGSTITISFGQSSDRFTISGSSYIPTEGNGASLAYDAVSRTYTYKTRSGLVYRFREQWGSNGAVAGLHDVAWPSGKKLTYGYQLFTRCAGPIIDDECTRYIGTYAISSITSNDGYVLAFLRDGDTDEFPGTHIGVSVSNSLVPGSGRAQYYAEGSGVTFNITDELGRITTYRPSAGGIAGIRSPGKATEDFTVGYDTSNRVASVTTPAGATSYAYSDTAGVRTTTVTNALGKATSYKFDISSQRMTSVTNALSQVTSFLHDSNGRLTETTAPEGNKAVVGYDGRGNVANTTLKAKPGSGLADIITTASYPVTCSNPLTCNSPDWTKDAKGNQTDYTYDATHGGVLTVTAPADTTGVRPQTRYSYTLTGGVQLLTGVSACISSASCVGTASEVRTTIGYNGNLHMSSITERAGDGSLSATTTVAYDAAGNVQTIDGPLAGNADTVRYRYDAARQLSGIVAPDPDGTGVRKPVAQRITRNPAGQVTLAEIGNVNSQADGDWAGFVTAEVVATGYDAADRPVKSELTAGGTIYGVSQTSYDALGRIDCAVQRMNNTAFGSLPTSACTLGTAGTDGPDRVTKTIYDNVGQVTKVQTAYGTAQQSDEVATSYTNNGQVAHVIDAENNHTASVYDGHDRLMKTEYPSTTKGANTANAADYEQLTYDANGNVTARRLRDGQTIAYTYDNLNRLTYYDQPVAGAYWDLAYEYDLLGRLKKTTGNGWAVNAFNYDALGRLTTEQNYNATTYHAYDTAGRQTRLTWHDGFYVDYDYDNVGNVTAIRENGATSGIGVLASYGYDDLGRRTSVTRGNGAVTNYGFDAVSRLASVTQNLAGTTHDLTLTFGYNPAGQIASNTRSNDIYAWNGHYNVDRTYTSNGLNQLTSAGSTAIGYDSRGNLTSSGSSTYGYTVENRLTTGPNGLTIAYEPTGERLLGVYNGNTGADTRFGWSGGQMITEFSASPWQVLRRYVPGPRVDEPIVWYEGSGTSDRRWLHADERGSVIAASASSGAAINVNRYDEYGIPASGNIGRLGYTGQAWIPELGMWYYRARVYSPTLGRFMQADPIGYADGMSWYNYVGSDPVNGTDPSGLAEKKPRVVCTGTRIASGCGSGGGSTGGGSTRGGVAHGRSPGSALAFGGGGGLSGSVSVYVPGTGGNLASDGSLVVNGGYFTTINISGFGRGTGHFGNLAMAAQAPRDSKTWECDPRGSGVCIIRNEDGKIDKEATKVWNDKWSAGNCALGGLLKSPGGDAVAAAVSAGTLASAFFDSAHLLNRTLGPAGYAMSVAWLTGKGLEIASCK